MSSHSAIRPLACWLGLAVAMTVPFSLGCGGKRGAPGQIEITGEVTFDGQPLPSGMIYFEPDPMAGSSGPQGYAKIVDGHYSTYKSGRGVLSGAHLVRIEEQQPIEGEKTRPMLFYEYNTEAELTDEATQQDFEIPADTAKRKGRR